MTDILEIDGSVLEGGGQILRISLSLSAILGVPIRIVNIRAGRSKPGLAAQHLKGIQLVAEMCQAKLVGDTIGSTTIVFVPRKIKGGHYVADIKTAGSISLLLQVALPCALLADGPVTLELKGGTNADMAPQIDFTTEVFRYNLMKFKADFSLEIHRRGYFPKGGGHVTVNVTPIRQFRSVSLTESGCAKVLRGWSFVAGTLPIKLAYGMAEGAKSQLNDKCEYLDIECYKEDPQMARDNCSGLILACEMSSGCVLGSDGLGKGRGNVQPYEVGVAAGKALRESLDLEVCLDARTQDQLIIYMALAEGKSAVKVGPLTLHTKTAMHIVELIAKVKFNVETNGNTNTIECVGLGYVNNAVR